MNKSDLVDAVAGSADMSKAEAGRAVEAVLDGISGALGNGDSVALVGFGTFSVRHRAARDGRNPQLVHQCTYQLLKFQVLKPVRDLKIWLKIVNNL